MQMQKKYSREIKYLGYFFSGVDDDMMCHFQNHQEQNTVANLQFNNNYMGGFEKKTSKKKSDKNDKLIIFFHRFSYIFFQAINKI